MMKKLSILILLVSIFSCTNFELDSEFDRANLNKSAPGLSVSKGLYKSIRIEWGLNDNAQGYIIYRGLSADSLTEIAYVAGRRNYYIDKDFNLQEYTAYYYAVKTVLELGEESSVSSAVAGDCSFVHFPDPNLEKAVRETLKVPANKKLYTRDVDKCTILIANGRKISDLRGIERLTSLENLGLWTNEITDLTPLSSLTSLKSLQLQSNNIVDLTPLANLTGLTELRLGNNNIVNIKPLENLTNLTLLVLSSNRIIETYHLRSLTKLKALYLDSNSYRDQFYNVQGLSDISFLDSKFNHLEELSLSFNKITDISSFMSVGGPNLPVIKNLQLAQNKIADFTPLQSLTTLTELDLNSTQMHDLTHLSGLTGLTKLLLYFNSDPDPEKKIGITNLTPLIGLTKLTHLNLSWNIIEDITPLSHLKELKTLKLYHNQISDIQPLYDLKKLSDLSLHQNKIQLITPLDTMTYGVHEDNTPVNITIFENPLKPGEKEKLIQALENKNVTLIYETPPLN